MRRTEPNPLRVSIQGNIDELSIGAGDWWVANLGWPERLSSGSIFPEVMWWLWDTDTVSSHPQKYGSGAKNFIDLTSGWVVVSDGHGWAEGMVFTPDGTLFFTDVPAGKLYKVARAGARSTLDENTESANGLALGPDGKIYGAAAGAKEVRAWDPPTGERETISSGTHLNDIVAHHKVAYLLHQSPGGESMASESGDARTKGSRSELPNPNGITLSADQSLLFVADFSRRHVFIRSSRTVR